MKETLQELIDDLKRGILSAPEARLLLTSDGLIETRVNELGIEPAIPHPKATAYREQQIFPFTAYDAMVPITSDFAVIQRFASAGLLDSLPRFRLTGQRTHYRLAFAPVRAGILAAGGLAPGLNMVIDSVIKRHGFLARAAGTEEAAGTGFPTGLEILGYLGGFGGLLSGERILLTHKTTDPVALAPGCFLGIRRGKKDADEGEIFDKMVAAVRRDQLDILYVLGGDGTLTAGNQLSMRLHDQGLRGPQGHPVRVVGAPKTMDNDIQFSDVTFGYETAVEEAVDFVRRIHNDVQACGRIGVIELFGADSGFVALDAANLSGEADDLLLPEECSTPASQNAEIERVSHRLAERWKRKGHAILVVAEGASGVFTHGQAAKKQVNFEDMFERIRNKILEFAPDLSRSDVISNRPQHLIRSVSTLASDLRLCKTIGKLMVDTALAGFSGCAVARWHSRFCLVPFALAAARKRRIDLDDDLVSISLDKRNLF